MTVFEDHFTHLARQYALYRPHYPAELYAYLASLPARRELAWDCGTGNGQAALGLAQHFARVIATDASAAQLAEAAPHERVEYRLEPADGTSLADGSVDLVTAAIAVHWFDLERFYPAVRRVAAPGGLLAVWTYHLPVISRKIDPLLRHYYHRILAGYWPPRIAYVEGRYRNLPFPFQELEPPGFEMQATWDLEQLAGFLGSWSAARRYQQEEGEHPLAVIWADLNRAWGESGRLRRVRWPLYLRIGRVG